ncbi:beta-alanyl-dopamine/carcinine hydrolase-like isoform X2 [Rhopalosiphum padi]|nr:beta-alanyl-dopamine/carcinine hydrolase-like isoform X2 [Rhopalosiphum padi]XP_060836568.1 beta-alanyl-dopamine/carcinine hydrolase-like isoform X2 [Rhopalosiphum padi]
MIGQTFGKVIRDFLDAYEPLKEYLEIYETSEYGRRVYNDCLEATNKYFPQYLIELKGMATGADVPFHKLFLIHLDDILISNIRDTSVDTSTGCSTLMVNIPCKGQFIGHNEDALSATINRFYIVSAHIKPKGEEGGGVFPVREEKWEAMTYAGSLSGYASGYNFDGLVFTINTIFAKKLNKKKIPRGFLTRALLASKANINEIQEILTNYGAGTADAFHVNAGFLGGSRSSRIFYSIEVTPLETEPMSEVIVVPIKTESTSFYTNKLQYSDCEELKESGWQSSVAREKTLEELMLQKPITSLSDILRILGSTRGGEWQIFRDRPNDFVNTINLGVFDFTEKTWTIWTNNPLTNPPILRLSLKFTTFISPTTDLGYENQSCVRRILSDVSDIYKNSLEKFKNMFDITLN